MFCLSEATSISSNGLPTSLPPSPLSGDGISDTFLLVVLDCQSGREIRRAKKSGMGQTVRAQRKLAAQDGTERTEQVEWHD